MEISQYPALSLQEAAAMSLSRPYLPYRPDPVILKQPAEGAPQPLEPLRVFDNVCWMGSKAVGVLVIDTGDGFIMIDSGCNAAEAAHIAGSFEKMGLDPSAVRLIVVSHEHFDHYGGIPYLTSAVCPEAMVAMSRTGWNLLQAIPAEFAFIEPRPALPDILIDDGLCMKLGDTRLLCVATPGHSAGCISFIFNSSLHGAALSVGVMGGSAVWPNFPEARLYGSSVEYFGLFARAAGCNAFAGAHQRESDLDRVRDHWDRGTPHPWVCAPEDYDSVYLEGFREMVRQTVASEKIQPYMMPVVPVIPPRP